MSVHDPTARLGKHGDYYHGYLLDVAMDADSELITAVNVIPANGDETVDAQVLITQEEAAQGNDVQALSIDGIGFRGKRLREWQDPQGLNLEVFVPPTPLPEPTGYFTPHDFATEEEGECVRCAKPIAAIGAKMMMNGMRRPKRVRVLSLTEPIIG